MRGPDYVWTFNPKTKEKLAVCECNWGVMEPLEHSMSGLISRNFSVNFDNDFL